LTELTRLIVSLSWQANVPVRFVNNSLTEKEHSMSTVAKVIELTSSSTTSIEDAIETGIKRADESLDQVEGAWVQDIKCTVKNGKIAEWRVNMKVTFVLNK
jgi:dodecin